MRLTLRRADQFTADFEAQVRWFGDEGGTELATAFVFAVDRTLEQLAEHPGLGRRSKFVHPKLQNLRSILVARPFNKYLVFYRFDSMHLYALRLMHGARDLPRRLLEPRDQE
jgi:plasmid stabilization system protein ParE